MKKLVMVILPLILFSCTNRSNHSANNVIPESFQDITYLRDSSANEVSPITHMIPKSFKQITYLLDTIANNYVFKTLMNISDVSLNEEGEIKYATQTNYSFQNQDGSKEESVKIYSPILYQSFGLWSNDQDSIPILLKYYKQSFTDTIIKDGEYTFRYNKNSRLISFSQAYLDDSPFVVIDFLYDLHGQWIQITKGFHDERGNYSSFEITKREIQYNDEPIKSFNLIYLTVNGNDIFNNSRGIVEYYLLLQKAGIWSPENGGGFFDESNGFFECEDEGTGAGVYTSQILGWRTSDGRDILGINGFSMDPGSSYPTTYGDYPAFYLFENRSFTKLTDIFPEVEANLFFDSDTDSGSIDGIPTYFTIQREEASIRYNLGVPIDFLRENYDKYKEICDTYSNIKRTSIVIGFDPIIGSFHVSN